MALGVKLNTVLVGRRAGCTGVPIVGARTEVGLRATFISDGDTRAELAKLNFDPTGEGGGIVDTAAEAEVVVVGAGAGARAGALDPELEANLVGFGETKSPRIAAANLEMALARAGLTAGSVRTAEAALLGVDVPDATPPPETATDNAVGAADGAAGTPVPRDKNALAEMLPVVCGDAEAEAVVRSG